ncbi:porin family protein [Myxococcota bacterium]|nr:porin family protein [Myxococcota bacterium]
MPIQGPASRPTQSIHTTAPTAPTAPATPTAQPQPASPSLHANSFEAGRSEAVALPPAVQERTNAALARFESTLRQTLHHDAMSLAAGHTPIRAGDPLSDAQTSALKDATKDLFLAMPIGALSPSASAELKSFLGRQGLSTEGIETKTLGDLGQIGGDLAKKWADDLKDNSPGVYYGALAAGAAAIGAYGYLEGSDALKKLGIKPEFKKDFFDKNLSIKAEGMWGKRFSDPNIRADINGRVQINPLTLRISSSIDARKLEDTKLGLGARLGDEQRHLDVQANGDIRNGLQDLTVSGRWSNDRLTARGTATLDDRLALREGEVGLTTRINDSLTTDLDVKFGPDWKPASAGGSVSYQRDNFRLNAGVRHEFGEDRTSAHVSASYTPTRDLELGLQGGYDSDRGGRIGVGLTWRF